MFRFRRALPLSVHLRRRRRMRIAIAVIAGVGLVIAGAVDRMSAAHRAAYDGRWFQVTEVIDADLIEIDAPRSSRPVRVRIWGVDAPETARLDPDGGPSDVAYAAERFAERLCAGRRVRVTLPAGRVHDRWGRLVAYVDLPDRSRLNERLLAAGWARVDARHEHEDRVRYEMLSRQAQRDGRGIWRGSGKAPPLQGAGPNPVRHGIRLGIQSAATASLDARLALPSRVVPGPESATPSGQRRPGGRSGACRLRAEYGPARQASGDTE